MTVPTKRAPEPPAVTEPGPTPGSTTASGPAFALAGLVGAVLAVSLGAYGNAHTPTGLTIEPLERDQLLPFKSALASVGAGLALLQLFSALWMHGKLHPLPSAPAWVGPAHRWSGTAAFVATLPAAYHCLWSLGFQDHSPRVLVHSILGCAFYGAISTKLLALRVNRMPGWAVPATGGAMVLLLVSLWLTSAFWFFSGVDLLSLAGAG
jgi:hypothetical protein